jgi:1,2-diacylglycerol 3-beta-glucosyltransferase
MNIVVILSWLSVIAGSVLLSIAGYLGLATLLSARQRPRESRAPHTRFAFVVPSHNEETGIELTVQSLFAVDYPRELFQTVVVADNCGDRTAELAARAGARVIERHDDTLRGKGYALEHAFDILQRDAQFDAYVIVDADTLVSKNILRAFAARIEEGEHAMQADYGVSNIDASWRTRLMTIALSVFHGVRSLARERMRVSAGLRGNGMCFTTTLLHAHPHKSYGLVEDVEYGIEIGLGGHRVAYVHEASVQGEMVSSGKAAASQRRRWEGGRRALVKARLPMLVGRALRERSLLLLDLAIDLVIPPLSTLVLVAGAGFMLEVVLAVVVGGPLFSIWPWVLSIVCLVAYVVRGAMLSPLGARGLLVLFWAPVYVLWKVLLVRPSRGDNTWVRTQREAEGMVTAKSGDAPAMGPTAGNETRRERGEHS